MPIPALTFLGLYKSNSAPPTTDQLWLDTSNTPLVVRVYQGTDWVQLQGISLGLPLNMLNVPSGTYSLTKAQSGTTVNHLGATTQVNINLPAATSDMIGVYYDFVANAFTGPSRNGVQLKINANGTDRITNPGNPSTLSLSITSTTSGDSIRLVCDAVGHWQGMFEETGNWI